jgi:predicted HTH domain antitoxin
MQITVELPADIAAHPNPGREALEALVIEGYKSRQLTQLEAARMLGLSRTETEDFLGRHVELYDYSTEELEAEAELLHRLHGRP